MGANEGYFSMFAATTLKAARVICVEPNSALWPVILRNVQPVSYTHLDVYKRQAHCKSYSVMIWNAPCVALRPGQQRMV